MIHFPPLRTERLGVTMRELTIGEQIDLAAIPPDRHERATSAMLGMVIVESTGAVASPADWTVEERTLAVAHYLSAVSKTGGNFEVGENARMADYLIPELSTAPASVAIGEACGNAWVMRQMTGREAEILESVCVGSDGWLYGDMAARLRAVGDAQDDAAPCAEKSPAEYTDWLAKRVDAFRTMPGSEFEELFAAYSRGRDELLHLFALGVSADGYVLLPAGKGGGDRELAPARFPVDSVICEVARRIGGRLG